MRRRAAIEPVIGHLKEDHRMRRNYLTGRHGDRINAVLAAAGYNFSLLLRQFEELLRVLSLILCHALLAAPLHLTRCRKTFFTADSLAFPDILPFPLLSRHRLSADLLALLYRHAVGEHAEVFADRDERRRLGESGTFQLPEEIP
jgi:hypothetical protein